MARWDWPIAFRGIFISPWSSGPMAGAGQRHGDTRLAFYREQGVPALRVLALLARWCGIDAPAAGIRAADLLDSFQLERLPREQIVFTVQEDAWLRS